MTYRTYTLEDHAKGKNYSFCLVCWPQEDIKLSIVQVKKIVSPSPVDLMPDTFCKVKGLEEHLCKVVALGTEAEMKAKLDELESDVDAAAKPPPRKKPCTRKDGAQRKGIGKENKTAQSTKKKTNKQGRILLVAAQPHDQSKLPGASTDSQSDKQTHPPLSLADHSNQQTQSPDQPSASADQQKNPETHSASTDQQKEQTQSQEQASTSADQQKEQGQLPALEDQPPSTSAGQHEEQIQSQPSSADQPPSTSANQQTASAYQLPSTSAVGEEEHDVEELTGADHDGMSSYENMEDDAGKTFFVLCYTLM